MGATLDSGAPVADAERLEVGALHTQLFVGGSWLDASDGRSFECEDPATERVLAIVADATPADGVASLAAAADVQAKWGATPPRWRATLLGRLHSAIIGRRDDFARLLTLEMGRPLAHSYDEVDYAADFVQWYAEEAVRINGRTSQAPTGGASIITTQVPVGPCLLVTPWNFPLAMLTRKLAPALAAGCSALVKPAHQTPFTSLLLAELLLEVGLPPGVVSVLPTSRSGAVVAAVMRDPRLRKVSFTGSTATGQQLMRQAADNVLRMSMELGGNAPFIVFDDADMEAAVRGAMVAKLRNMGESCTAANRFYVHETLVDEFSARLAVAMDAQQLGHGLEPGTDVGPLIDRKQQRGVQQVVARALEDGATLRTTRTDIPKTGYFAAPAVLTGVGADDGMLRSEIFGPVAPIVSFTDDDQVLELANGTPHGLVCFVYTESFRRVRRVGRALETGMIGVNRGIVSNAAAPFGGVKHSGFGREGGPEGLSEYLSIRYLAIDDPESSTLAGVEAVASERPEDTVVNR